MVFFSAEPTIDHAGPTDLNSNKQPAFYRHAAPTELKSTTGVWIGVSSITGLWIGVSSISGLLIGDPPIDGSMFIPHAG